MDAIFNSVTPAAFVLATLVGLLAGLIKGLTGFGMPMVLISGLSLVVPPDAALAALILPTVLTNVWQALRQGLAAAWASVRRFGVFLVALVLCLIASAQTVRMLPADLLFLAIGVPVVAFAALQLSGWQPRLRPASWVEAGVGAFAGRVGGVAGVWGPPTVAYLAALDTPKAESVRVQGVIYGIGAVVLLGAHLQSGVLRAETLPLSIAMLVPAGLGMWLGLIWQDRIDQRAFRRATLIVLLVAGANLIRRGLMA